MSEWNVCSIDELGSVNRGKSKHRPRNDVILFGGLYPFIQTSDVKNANLYISEYDTTYSEIGLAQSKLWKKGTLCITIAANIAESAILGIDACFPDSVVGFMPYEGKADLKFVKYMLDEFKVYMQQISKGTTQDNLSLEKLRRIKFYVPSYETQQKIAHILSRYDEAIENNNKRIKLLEQMAQNLYKEWFVRFRFPGYENCEFENGIPMGWHQGRLSELLEFKRGKNITADEMEDGDVSVISAGLEPSGYHSTSNVQGVSLTISSSGANAGYLSIHYEDIWAADCMFITEKNTKNIYYLYELLNNIRPVIFNQQRGAAQPHVYSKDINNLRLWIPNEELIENANKLFESFHKEIYKLQRANKNLAKQRDLLLPRLMSGKLEVN